MSTLKEFSELVNSIKDEELLDVAEGLLKEITDMHNMREKADMIEEGLTKGKKAAFWFFAIGLDPEQVSLAANTVTGRRRYLKEMADREAAKNAHSEESSMELAVEQPQEIPCDLDDGLDCKENLSQSMDSCDSNGCGCNPDCYSCDSVIIPE